MLASLLFAGQHSSAVQGEVRRASLMNSLASILYSSTKKRKNLSFQPSRQSTRCKANMLFRSSTPKTLNKPTVTAHPTWSTSSSLSIQSSQSPRCSTPILAQQRRTRPYLACELCRQRAFGDLNVDEKKTSHRAVKKDEEQKQDFHHRHSTTLHYYQCPTTYTSIRRRRRSSLDQLLVWII